MSGFKINDCFRYIVVLCTVSLILVLVQTPTVTAQSEVGKLERLQQRRAERWEAVQTRWQQRIEAARNELFRKRSALSNVADEQDSLALVQFYQETNGANWTERDGWLAGPVAVWHGIKLNAEGRVTTLDLRENRVNGLIPDALGSLTALDTVRLADNTLRGFLPDTLRNLTQLKILDLGRNQLRGPVPDYLGTMAELVSLGLDNNLFTDELPASIGQLQNLRDLFVWNNGLSGELPLSLGNLVGLRRMWFDGNNFSGSIPDTLGNLTNLTELFLDINQFTGEIPSSLGNLSNVRSLFLSNNELTGEVPVSFADLNRLENLVLSDNNLSGSFPVALTVLPNLSTLFLSDNQFVGPLPDEIVNLGNLTKLHLAGNGFKGDIPERIALIPFMREFNLADNEFTGTLPAIGFWSVFRLLDVTNNFFSSPFPDPPTSIYEIKAAHNQFAEPFPVSIALMPRVRILDLSDNAFFGEVPIQVTNMASLMMVDLSNNQIEGALPAGLGRLTLLTHINLRNNAFTGALPELWTVPNRLEVIDVGGNFVSAVPEVYNELTSLTTLLLDTNQLTTLPDLSGMTSLRTFHVENNRLTFEALEPNIGLATFTYAPQDTVLTVLDRLESDVTYAVNVGGANNQYQWFRNRTPEPGATESRFALSVAEADNAADTLHAEVTNTVVPNLTLYSRPVRSDAVLQEITIEPDSVRITFAEVVQFSASGLDQMGHVLHFTPQWAATGGEVDSTGLFIAGTVPGLFEVAVTDQGALAEARAQVDILSEIPVSIEADADIPTDFALHSNYPNPFNPQTRIGFDVAQPTPVRLTVYNIHGQIIRQLVDAPYAPGRYEAVFDAHDLPSGLYVYQIEMSTFRASGKMVLIK